ncbi:hypothetical protein ScPMuIL_008207 [Solemya velum]
MDSNLHYTSVNHAYHLIGAINNLRQNSELCDVILAIKEHHIAAHKLILSVCSPYFHDLLENKLYNQNNFVQFPLQLNDVDAKAVQHVIEFFYTSAITVNDDNVWELLPTAYRLKVEELVSLCADYLLSQIKLGNCLNAYSIASECGCNSLQEETSDFIKQNFEKILIEETFLDLSVESLLSHLRRLSTESGTVDEEQVLEAIKSWYEHSADDRQKVAYHIVKRFPELKDKLRKFIPEESLEIPEEPVKEEPMDMDDSQANDTPIKDLPELSPGFFSSKLSQLTKSFNGNGVEYDPQMFICIECAEVFDTKAELENHGKTHSAHMKTSPLKKIVRKPFQNYEHEDFLTDTKEEMSHSLLSEELRNGGTNEKPNHLTITVTSSSTDGTDLSYICPVCGKVYMDRITLSTHLKVHSENDIFSCTVCDKVFSTKVNLQVHMKQHTSEKIHMCHLCDKTFTSYCVLKVHLRTHTGEKPFTCSTCGASFAKNIHLKRHSAIHTGEKPHVCQICEKRFSRSDHLKRHIQSIHSQERPHICTICGKDFGKGFDLKRHMTVHTGEKPHECKYCGKKFGRLDQVKRHIQTIHMREKSPKNGTKFLKNPKIEGEILNDSSDLTSPEFSVYQEIGAGSSSSKEASPVSANQDSLISSSRSLVSLLKVGIGEKEFSNHGYDNACNTSLIDADM